MTKNEKILAGKILQMASNDCVNNFCNDVDDSIYEGWTHEERKQFVKEYHEWNGDPESYTEGFVHIPDFALMSFLAYKIHQSY